MLTNIIVGAVCLVVGAIGGVLVGRKNKAVGDEAQKLLDKVNK